MRLCLKTFVGGCDGIKNILKTHAFLKPDGISKDFEGGLHCSLGGPWLVAPRI